MKLGDSLILGTQVALEEGILTYPKDCSEFLCGRFSVFKHADSDDYWISSIAGQSIYIETTYLMTVLICWAGIAMDADSVWVFNPFAV
jgi:hypothetical protein